MRTIDDVAQAITQTRKRLNLEQSDLYMRIGMKQQQYQRIEAGNDVRLSTLLRVLEGLDLELQIVSREVSKQADAKTDLEELNDTGDNLDFWLSGEEK